MAKNPLLSNSVGLSDLMKRHYGPSSSLGQQVKEAQEEIASKKLWEEMRQATKHNVTLQDEFDRFKAVYLLTKTQSKGGADGG